MFRAHLDALQEVNWPAVNATDFRSPEIKEGKQAEFLLQRFFPWELVEHIGTQSTMIAAQVTELLRGAAHRPQVDVRPRWYF